jgi:hypothetical protein
LSSSALYGILGSDMVRIDYFVPGDERVDDEVLSHLRWPIPAGVTQAFVEAYTDPGETVLVPYCQGPASVREILAAERRALALNFDPLLILVVEAALTPPPPRELNAAVARLGDSLKQGMPLRRYLAELYATTCPACLRPTVADYFIWDREQEAPVAKSLRCPACAWDGQATVEAEDQERLAGIPARGMHYHYVLDRVAPRPQADAIRNRLEPLLELYSPRSLYALAELTLKIESLFPAGPLQVALKALLLDCLDRCSSLSPLPGSVARRRGLARPSRFVERNVWHTFEEAITRLQAMHGKPVSGLAGSLETFHTPGQEHPGFVGQGLVRDLPRSLPPRSIRLILVGPPPLNSTAWSLSYVWGAWLLGAEAAAPSRSLLRQRTPDPTWYARVMAGSLRALAGLLRDDGRLVVVLTDQRTAVVEALLLACSSARLGLTTLVQRGADYRLELCPTFQQSIAVSSAPLEDQIQEASAQAAAETIQARGEPVAWRTLHAAIQQRLAESGLLSRILEADDASPFPLDLVAEQVKAGLDVPTFVQLPGGKGGETLWWLAHPADLAAPLSDRVEETGYQVLQDALALTEAGFVEAVNARFPGTLTPEADLVTICLRAYAHEPTPGYWKLRNEDLPGARQAEQQAIIEHLLTLGRRLGYRAEAWNRFEAAWFKGEQVRALLAVHWRAAVSEALALSDQTPGARPYLVIPGGRAALASYKLAHNPLWQQAVDKAGWQFIKYRHVRQLVAQPEVDEYALQTIVGLDPIVEREGAQIPLF